MENGNTTPTDPEAFILVIGKPGAGKSTLAMKLQTGTGFSLIDTHTLRQESIEDGITTNGFTINSQFQNSATQTLTSKIRNRLREIGPNIGIIIEGVWKTDKRRAEIIQGAKDQNRPVILIEVTADYQIRQERVTNRKMLGVGVEPTNRQDVLDSYEGNFDAVRDIEGINYILLDTTKGTTIQEIHIKNSKNSTIERVLSIIQN